MRVCRCELARDLCDLFWSKTGPGVVVTEFSPLNHVTSHFARAPEHAAACAWPAQRGRTWGPVALNLADSGQTIRRFGSGRAYDNRHVLLVCGAKGLDKVVG